MSLEQDLKLLNSNKEMRSITSYVVSLLKDTKHKENLLRYKYLCSTDMQESLRRVNNDTRFSDDKIKINENNRRLSIKDWARDRGVHVNRNRAGGNS